jgi:hypothetical protein
MNESNFTGEQVYQSFLGGASVFWAFRFPETEQYLQKWITGTSVDPTAVVRVSEAEFSDWASFGNKIDAFAEFCLLCQQTSEALLPQNRCVIHAGAIRFRDKAFLIAGGSGVGKSTQIKTLMEVYPDDITGINGDKPAVEARDDGTVIIHPSPWNGKEGWHGAEAAPLGGVFLLRRGAQNSIKPVAPGAAAAFLYQQIFQSYCTQEMIRLAGLMGEKILKSAPVWLFTNKDVPDSTRLLMKTMKEASHGI